MRHPLCPTSERTVLIVLYRVEKRAFTSSSPEIEKAGERKGSFFFEGIPGNRSSGEGPVAQRIRARGYEPRCRGFESLLAHNRPKGEGLFSGVGK